MQLGIKEQRLHSISLRFTSVRCSHGVRKGYEKSSYEVHNRLIFSVGHPGLEPGTSRL